MRMAARVQHIATYTYFIGAAKSNIHTNHRLTQQKKNRTQNVLYSAKYVQITERSVGGKAACRLRAHIYTIITYETI